MNTPQRSIIQFVEHDNYAPDSYVRGGNTIQMLEGWITRDPKRSVGIGVLGAGSLLYAFLFGWELVRPTRVVVQDLLNVVSLTFALGLFVGVVWLWRQWVGGDQVLRVVSWSLGATVPLVVMGFLGVGWQMAMDVQIRGAGLVVWYLGVVGTFGGFLIGVYDVERHRSTGRFRAIVQAAPTAIVALDMNGRVITFNESAEAMFGWSAEEAIGSIPPYVPDDRRSRFLETIDRVRTGEDLRGERATRRRKDGSLIDVDIWTSRITEPDSGVVGIMTVLIDVTEQQRRDQALSVLRRILRHNLRNDGDVILGHSRQITRAVDGLPADNAVGQDIRRSAEKIDAAADELVRLGEKARRMERVLERQETDLRRVDLCTTLQELRSECANRHPEASITVTCHSRAVLEVTCRIDLVFEELLENAIEHANRPDPTVDIEVDRDDGWIFTRIVDDGPGVPDVEAKALEKEEESALVHTSGLGLWLVNWVVAGVGGTLALRENEHGGCSAITKFPTGPREPPGDSLASPPTDERREA